MAKNRMPLTAEGIRKRKLITGFLAIALGLGGVLFDQLTGAIGRIMAGPSRLLMYVPLIVLSIWGLKQLLSVYSPESHGGALSARLSRYTFHLPLEGYGFLVMMIVMFISAMMGGSNMLLLVFTMMAGPFIINGWVTFTMLQRMSVTRDLPRRAMAGVPFSVQVTLENRKYLIASFLMSVRDQIRSKGEQINANVLFASVPAGEKRTTPYQLRLTKRGKFDFGPVEITTRFPLGFVERGSLINAGDAVIVHPKTGQLASSWKRILNATGEMTEQKVLRLGAFDDDFSHIREYRDGDDVRNVHWKTSARREELMVREYRENRDRNMILVLDLWRPKKASKEEKIRVENAVSLASTIGVEQIRTCGDLSLEVLSVGKTESHWVAETAGTGMESFLDAMAVLEAGLAKELPQTFNKLISMGPNRQRVVIISTRPNAAKAYREGELAESIRGDFLRLDDAQLIDADPEKTALFFTLE